MNSKTKELLIFWSRMAGWLVTGCAAPIGVFAYKFGLFKSASYGTVYDELGNVIETSVSLNGWGIISCFLVGYTAVQIINELLDSLQGYSLKKQIITGIKSKVIPLVVAFFICFYLKDVLDQIMFCLATLIISQLAAIPLNPLPAWKHKKNGTEDYTDILNGLVKTLKNKIKKK